MSKSAKNQVLALNPGGLMKKHKKSMVINKKNKAFGLPAGSESFENPSGGHFGRISEGKSPRNLAKC